MQKFILIVICVLVVVAFVVLIVGARRSISVSRTEQQPPGFEEWVRNPDERQRVAEEMRAYMEARDSLSVPDDLSDEEIRQMVERLFVQKDHDFNTDRLELVGQRAVPFLIDALDDPRVAVPFVSAGYTHGPEFPLQRVCGLLQPHEPDLVVKTLTEYVDHQDDRHRKYVASVLGEIGTPECLSPVTTLLDDEDDYVRADAMVGIRDGINEGSCTREFLDGVVPALTKLLDREDGSVSGSAPMLLLRIDSERAIPILLSPEYFSIENRQVQYIVKALNEAGHRIPHDRLLPLLQSVEPLQAEYPHSYTYAYLLKAYAAHPDADAESTFRRALNSPDRDVQESAAESLGILFGITAPRRVVFEAVDEVGFDRLSKQQQHYVAVIIYDSEVRNGGHSQYFVNSSGENWEEAIAGFKAIGAKERAGILEEACELFGESGPAKDHDTRHEELAKLTDEQFEVLDRLDSRYYACKENVDALLARYTIEYKAHFVAD